MLLKRIVDKLPSELASLIPELESAGIKTTESVIFTHQPTIISSTSTLNSQQLEALVSYCIRLTAGKSQIASDIDNYEVIGPWLGFGVKGLDELLDDWDGVGVLEIAGPRKVGKSLLALHAALNVLVENPEAICTWMDTEGTFAPERAGKVLEAWKIQNSTSVLSRITVLPCFKLDDMYEALGLLKETAISQAEEPRTKILIIDNIFTYFKDRLTNTSAQGHAELVTVMEDVANITYSQNIVSIVINSTVTSIPTNPLSRFNKLNIKPALGSSFTYTTDATLLIQETGKVFGMLDEEERERIKKAPGLRGSVEIVRSRISQTEGWAVFETDGTKLYDVVAPSNAPEYPRGVPRPATGPLRNTMIP
ncbi:hypothetical protein C361_01647 [Cryptococcus neoformans Tu259-1]|uniref:Rad51-like C-terminal domain-containing protein n=1 Tax=Cryptococcus neoformans Tu259-1 TaxID=1230072 RepID=A0A854QP61_CRYNE|nr:hypothetical protein C361_01647 [Cryptococcus neoformans var. grubii Tu259-1]